MRSHLIISPSVLPNLMLIDLPLFRKISFPTTYINSV